MMTTLATARTPLSMREWGVVEALLDGDVGRGHGLAGFEGVCFGRIVGNLDPCGADDAGFPADAGACEQCLAVRLQLHDLGKVGAEGLADQAAGFGEDFIEVVGFEGEFAKPGEGRLLPK